MPAGTKAKSVFQTVLKVYLDSLIIIGHVITAYSLLRTLDGSTIETKAKRLKVGAIIKTNISTISILFVNGANRDEPFGRCFLLVCSEGEETVAPRKTRR